MPLNFSRDSMHLPLLLRFHHPCISSSPPFIIWCHCIEPLLLLPTCTTSIIHILVHYDSSDLIFSLLFAPLCSSLLLFIHICSSLILLAPLCYYFLLLTFFAPLHSFSLLFSPICSSFLLFSTLCSSLLLFALISIHFFLCSDILFSPHSNIITSIFYYLLSPIFLICSSLIQYYCYTMIYSVFLHLTSSQSNLTTSLSSVRSNLIATIMLLYDFLWSAWHLLLVSEWLGPDQFGSAHSDLLCLFSSGPSNFS